LAKSTNHEVAYWFIYTACEIRGFWSSVDKVFCLLGYDIMPLGRWLPMLLQGVNTLRCFKTIQWWSRNVARYVGRWGATLLAGELNYTAAKAKAKKKVLGTVLLLQKF
jgi:hypothetical protein